MITMIFFYLRNLLFAAIAVVGIVWLVKFIMERKDANTIDKQVKQTIDNMDYTEILAKKYED